MKKNNKNKYLKNMILGRIRTQNANLGSIRTM